MSLLSTKSIPAKERLIVALDVESSEQALALVDELGDSVTFYKMGLELLAAGNYFDLATQLIERRKKVFVDLKFFDVPETVGRAVSRLEQYGIHFATVHGNEEMVRAAAAAKSEVKVLAVTVLTSLDNQDIADLGFTGVNVEELVFSRARRALDAGADGVISSGLEAPRLREGLGDRFLVVSPGIRPVENRLVDDQKRVVTVEDAFRNGADYIVVGRPIRDAADPKAAADDVQTTIRALFEAG